MGIRRHGTQSRGNFQREEMNIDTKNIPPSVLFPGNSTWTHAGRQAAPGPHGARACHPGLPELCGYKLAPRPQGHTGPLRSTPWQANFQLHFGNAKFQLPPMEQTPGCECSMTSGRLGSQGSRSTPLTGLLPHQMGLSQKAGTAGPWGRSGCR